MDCKGFGKRRSTPGIFLQGWQNHGKRVTTAEIRIENFPCRNPWHCRTPTSLGGHTAASTEQGNIAVDLYVGIRVRASVGTTVLLIEVSRGFRHSLQKNIRSEPPINHRRVLSNTFQFISHRSSEHSTS
jgi:DUF1680 family protein